MVGQQVDGDGPVVQAVPGLPLRQADAGAAGRGRRRRQPTVSSRALSPHPNAMVCDDDKVFDALCVTGEDIHQASFYFME